LNCKLAAINAWTCAISYSAVAVGVFEVLDELRTFSTISCAVIGAETAEETIAVLTTSGQALS